MPGDESHILLHCPHFSPLIQPAIDSLMLNLRQFDLRAWAKGNSDLQLLSKELDSGD